MMGIVRGDQVEATDRGGITGRALASPDTGATQLRVSDITIAPGAEITYHLHPETEASHYVIEGELECVVADHRVTLRPGDMAMAPAGVGHSFANRSGAPARMIAFFPHSSPGREYLDPGPAPGGPLPESVVFHKDVTPWECWPGATRYDVMNAAFGAVATAFSEIVFNPGSIAPPHYHPETEEAMYCLRGELTVMYAGDESPLHPGDTLLAAPGVRHSVFNASDAPAVLLALHPTVVPVRVDIDWEPEAPLPAIR